MHFVGVDLAWGERRPTGVAVLASDGRLLRVAACTDDASIETVLGPYVAGDCLVAIDASLVVVNAGGNRPCERALNRDFARFDAGAHPSNTARPEFAGTPRGARLAAALGLDLDPDSTAPRRAIEVYPHPATVALFGLGRTLKYKQKPGRPLDLLRSELLRLMHLLEGLADSPVSMVLTDHAPWRDLVAQVETAGRKSELRRVEDQVDAVVCAYVARFAVERPDQVTTYGDLATGYIVTPTLPAGLRPTPRGAVPPEDGTADSAVRAAVRGYAELRPALLTETDRMVEQVTMQLDDAGINYLSVGGRTKSVASFAAKAERAVDGTPVYTDALTEITDQIGVRVVTYLQSDVAAVADLLSDQLSVLDDRDMGQETASQGRFGYASRHLLVDTGSVRPAQVQIRTVLQHAWAEFEHAIRYKGTIPQEQVPELDRRFTLAAGLLELADHEFTSIRDQLQATSAGSPGSRMADPQPEPTDSDPRIGSQELAAFLAGTYPDADWSRTDHYAWMSGLLLELGVTSLDQLAEVLGTVDSAALNASMGYRHPPRAVRRLDDALLTAFGDRYLRLHGNAHRTALLENRLSLAERADPGVSRDRLGPPEPGTGHPGRRQGDRT